MARRKSKKPQQEDTSILLDSSVPQSRGRTNSFASPALLFIIILTAGASVMGWFCVQQQHSLDQLSGSFTAMQNTITTLQQVMEVTQEQTDTDLGAEERIFSLEEAQKQAQERAEVALATSENLKKSGLYLQLLDLHDEMDTRLAEMKQVTLSVTTLQAMFKNQSEEFEAVKESVAAGLSSSSALAENVAGLTDAVVGACSRVDEQVASVEALNAQLEGQASELNELKEELVEAKQAMHAQALEEMLSSVQLTLDEQFVTSQTLHSSVMAQLQTFHTQLANAPSMPMKVKSNEEGPAAEEITPTTAQNATEVQEKLGDDEEQAEQQDAEDEAEEEADEEAEEEEEEEEEEDEVMQEEQSLEQEVDGDVTEEEEEEEIIEEEEEITPEEQEDKDIAGQSEEQEVSGETAEEETEDGHVLDESLEEEISEEVVESWETVEEESAELNSEVFMDKNEEDE